MATWCEFLESDERSRMGKKMQHEHNTIESSNPNRSRTKPTETRPFAPIVLMFLFEFFFVSFPMKFNRNNRKCGTEYQSQQQWQMCFKWTKNGEVEKVFRVMICYLKRQPVQQTFTDSTHTFNHISFLASCIRIRIRIRCGKWNANNDFHWLI